jgi:predicted nucleotidyltransferase
MQKDVAIAKLRENAEAARALGATALYLFGSTARDEARPDSDLDIFVEYDPAAHFSLMDLAGIKIALEEELGVEVHVTTRDSLRSEYRRRIETDAVKIF